MLRTIKNALVPNHTRYFRVQSGVCKGCNLPLNLHNEFIVYLGLYEQELKSIVKKNVKRGYCSYDIGSAKGYYTLALARLAEDGSVLAFEADPKLLQLLPETIKQNPAIKSTIIPMNYFVGAEVDLDKYLISVDYVVYEMDHRVPNLLKIDVEGAELDVLQGAERVIREYKPYIIIEVHSLDLEHKCQKFLGELGYLSQIVSQRRSVFWKEKRPIEHNQWLVAFAN